MHTAIFLDGFVEEESGCRQEKVEYHWGQYATLFHPYLDWEGGRLVSTNEYGCMHATVELTEDVKKFGGDATFLQYNPKDFPVNCIKGLGIKGQ